MSKQNHALSAFRNAQVSIELNVTGANVNIFRLGNCRFRRLTHLILCLFLSGGFTYLLPLPIFSSLKISSSKISSSVLCRLPSELLTIRSQSLVSCWLPSCPTCRF